MLNKEGSFRIGSHRNICGCSSNSVKLCTAGCLKKKLMASYSYTYDRWSWTILNLSLRLILVDWLLSRKVHCDIYFINIGQKYKFNIYLVRLRHTDVQKESIYLNYFLLQKNTVIKSHLWCMPNLYLDVVTNFWAGQYSDRHRRALVWNQYNSIYFEMSRSFKWVS